jgi:hypothetical protein
LKRGTGVNEKFLVRLNLPKIHPKIFFSEWPQFPFLVYRRISL